jgi:subtilisin-like proprotein convertase family protein
VVLTTQPTADVTVPVSTTDPSEGTTLPVSSLTFTPATWNVRQQVTVVGVNDAFADGDKTYSVVFGAASSTDNNYSGRDPADVSVTNIDDDIVVATFTKTENKKIPDRGTYTSSLTVSPTGNILDLNVRVNINHEWDEDLDVFLIAPDGTRTELFTDVGGMGVNFTNTVLDDAATTPITSGTAPFTGTYLPEGNLTLLEGKSLTGTWKLEAKDDGWLVSGTLVDWSITARYTSAAAGPDAVVTPTSGLVTTEAGGTASFTVRLNSPPIADVVIPISSSDLTEGTASPASLVFTNANWASAQTVTVTGVNDTILDGNIAYTIVLGTTTSADPDFHGLNPTDVSVSNTDNEVPPTKFYVVNDATQNLTYEYDANGDLVESYSLNSGNTTPRGAASTVAGDRTWVVDANRNVYVYNTSGSLLGSWTAGTLASNATVEGITTNGTDVWIVDAQSDKVYKYTGAASRLSGNPTASSSFSLNSGNRSPKDIVTDGTSLWVINDTTTDKVFKYTLSGTLLGSWTISGGGGAPTGITLNPASVNHLWIVDSSTDRVYQFDGAATRTSSSQSPSIYFPLASGNTNPQGIADPPVPSPEPLAESTVVAHSAAGQKDLALVRETAPVLGAAFGSRAASRVNAVRPVAITPRGVDAVMSRCEAVLEPMRPLSSIARTMPSTARRTIHAVDLYVSDDTLDSTLELLANDVAVAKR